MDFATARHNMVEGQIRPNHVTDPLVIDALAGLARESFVPGQMRGVAYMDEAVPLGGDRFLMEPPLLARLVQELSLSPDNAALVIGCATGYSAAVLARLVNSVVAVESDSTFVENATATLGEMGIDNAVVVEGALADGYPGHAPYDAIFFDGSVAEVPEKIISQLSDGGRLVAVVQGEKGFGKACLWHNSNGIVSRRTLFDAGSPSLPGFAVGVGFVF
ncbi:MAG: protein-L-isoaspartate O-methyltransferase [Rhodospirillales bacterium]|nr:protein-L-isoaspartate O-methyltransferase [Rhodospirillales bacterium]